MKPFAPVRNRAKERTFLANPGKQYGIYVGPIPLKKGEKAELGLRSLTLELSVPEELYRGMA